MFFVISQWLGTLGVFSSRAFLPAFVAAVLVRFGGEWPWLERLGLSGDALPPWFTHWISISVLGGLAGLEFFAHRNADARQLLAYIDHYAKPVMAGLTTFGLLSSEDARAAGQILGSAAGLPEVQQAGLADALPALASMAFTFWTASARNDVLQDVHHADPGDETGIQRLFAWGEDLWAVFGTVLILLFPFLIALAVAVAGLVLFVLRRRAKRREEAGRGTCAACNEPIYRCALACPNCRTPNPDVRDLNWLGATADRPAGPPEEHALRLVSAKRCPRCATRLTSRSPQQHCPACDAQPLADADLVTRYDQYVALRLPLTLALLLALSAVPVLGLVPGVILYRLRLVAPFRRYLPAGADLVTRWFLRALFFALVLLHLVPAVGMVTLPLLALANWAAYRHSFLRRVPRAELAPT